MDVEPLPDIENVKKVGVKVGIIIGAHLITITNNFAKSTNQSSIENAVVIKVLSQINVSDMQGVQEHQRTRTSRKYAHVLNTYLYMAVYSGKRKRSSETSNRYSLWTHKTSTKANEFAGKWLKSRAMQIKDSN